MTPITIPQKAVGKGDLVIIPLREYEEFLAIQRLFRTVRPTVAEQRAIARGRREVVGGKYREWTRVVEK